VTDELFILLQINDAAFPIGAYAHSYGLETYIQEGLVKCAESAAAFIGQYLRNSFLYTDLLAARLAYEAAQGCRLGELGLLEDLIFASRIPREAREASLKLGTRFVKTVALLLPQRTVFSDYAQSRADEKAKASHAVAYGVFSAAAGIRADDGMAAFLYAQAAALAACCVKTIPLSQTDGQRILSGCRALFGEILGNLAELGRDDLCRSCPGLDIRAMRHENLYSRLYMS
jgi:urease accessory protein